MDADLTEGTPANAAPTEIAPETTAASQQTAAEVTQAASQETPAQVEPAANEREIADRLALLEKRTRDTEEAFREKQRLLHETTGQIKAAQEMAERFKNEQFRMSPEAAQKQREEFLERVRLDPSAAVEWAERNMQGQAQWIEQKIAALENQFKSQLEDLDPVVQRNRDQVERLRNDPDFAGLSKKQIANLAEKFKGITQPETAKPPPAPAGARRSVDTAKPKDVLPPWWRGMIAKKNDSSIKYDGDIRKEGGK